MYLCYTIACSAKHEASVSRSAKDLSICLSGCSFRSVLTCEILSCQKITHHAFYKLSAKVQVKMVPHGQIKR